MILRVKRLHPSAVLPTKGHTGDAGLDLYSVENIKLSPMERVLVSVGISIELPQGFEAQIRPRSGLAFKKGVTVLNSPGTVDQGYRGEIGVILINHNSSEISIEKGDRIAQMVVKPIIQVDVVESREEFSETDRGEGGIGSTGA